MKKFSRLASALCIAYSSIILTGCGGSSSKSEPVVVEEQPVVVVEQPVAMDYQTLIDSAISDTIPGIVLLVDSPENRFLGSAGVASRESLEAMQVSAVMPNGSAGKKLTALLVAQLADQGLLSLDETIDHWLPEELLSQIEHSEKMTLRQLLNHTAGVYDYLDDDDYESAVFHDPESLKTDAYVLQFALNKPASFEPGEGWDYSNTGYLLAGLILDEVLGQHHSQEIRGRILEPLGMNASYYGGVESERGEIIDGYYALESGEVISTKAFYHNIGIADAPLVANVEDVALLLKTIIEDDSFVGQEVREALIGESNLQSMGDGKFYGMGVIKETINDTVVYHHGGEEAGYSTTNIYIPSSQTSITAFFNCGGYEACEQETDEVVHAILREEL